MKRILFCLLSLVILSYAGTDREMIFERDGCKVTIAVIKGEGFIFADSTSCFYGKRKFGGVGGFKMECIAYSSPKLESLISGEYEISIDVFGTYIFANKVPFVPKRKRKPTEKYKNEDFFRDFTDRDLIERMECMVQYSMNVTEK